MKIPASFKIGLLEYKVFLTEKIQLDSPSLTTVLEKQSKIYKKDLINAGMLFGLCDASAQTIWIATKDIQGNDISVERMVTTFYHEVAHALVGETANLDCNADEVFIEALGKNIYYFCSSVSDEDAPLYEEEECEEVKEKPQIKNKKTSKK